MNSEPSSYEMEQPLPARSRAGRMLRMLVTLLFLAAVFGAGWLASHGSQHSPGGEAAAARAGATSKPARRLWTCSMHPQVIRDEPGVCPICHMQLTPMSAGGGATATAGTKGKKKVKYWWDPMIGPASISDKPGKSAMGMDLVPVYEDQASGGMALTIDPAIVQNMGVRLAAVKKGALAVTVRAVGELREPSPAQHDVNLRVSGWIETLYANVEGMEVRKGEPLFDLYSPDVQVAAQELIAARKGMTALGKGADPGMKRTAQALFDAARQKLRHWGLTDGQVEALARQDQAPPTVAILSPVDGHIIEKRVYEGAAVKAGDLVLRLSSRGTMWLDARVFEQDLPRIKVGQRVTASISAWPGKRFEGQITFIHPHLDERTRTGMVRVELPNPHHALRQGMYATVRIVVPVEEEALTVPRAAVLDTGRRQLVFISEGAGHFSAREVTLGAEADDGSVQVLSGLKEGELVVTSGQFLLDSESRLKEAIQKHLEE